MVKSILNGVAMGSAHWAKVHDPTVVEGDCHLEWEVCVTTGHALVQMHVTDLAEAQREDPVLSAVLDWLKALKKTDLKVLLAQHTSSEEGWLILRNQQNFMIHQGVLYLHSMPKGEAEDLLLLIVPKAHQVNTLNWCHRDAGHQGRNCTLSLLWEHFWWLGMTNQMQQSIKSYACCLQHEGSLYKAPLYPIVATAPVDLLHVDFTSIEMTLVLNRPPKIANVLVFQDHFMKHIKAYVTPDQAAKTVTKSLYEGFILIFGAPARLLSNWGANFTSNIIDKMCKLLNMRKLWTMPYHAHMNGLVERSHQTIMQMIGKLGEDKKADWPGHLAEIVHAYNATQSAMMGYSPHYLMFGHRPRLPVNFYFPTFRSAEVPMRGASAKCVDEYMATVHDQMRTNLWEAQAQSTAEGQWQKWYYNWKIGAMDLKAGDLVLVKADAFQAKRKIKHRWEDEPHEVVHQSDRCPLIQCDKPTWTVMCPTLQLTSIHCIRNWHSPVHGCLSGMGQMYQLHPS